MISNNPRSTSLTGPYAKPKVRGSGCLFQPATLEHPADHFLPLDSPAWFAWLKNEVAFRVEQVYHLANTSQSDPFFLRFTVRPERRQRGQLYWYAYKKYHNRRLSGSYLGPSSAVTLYHLDRLASRYLAQIDPDFHLRVAQIGLLTQATYSDPSI
jgi:hypothetical protein